MGMRLYRAGFDLENCPKGEGGGGGGGGKSRIWQSKRSM